MSTVINELSVNSKTEKKKKEDIPLSLVRGSQWGGRLLLVRTRDFKGIAVSLLHNLHGRRMAVELVGCKPPVRCLSCLSWYHLLRARKPSSFGGLKPFFLTSLSFQLIPPSPVPLETTDHSTLHHFPPTGHVHPRVHHNCWCCDTPVPQDRSYPLGACSPVSIGLGFSFFLSSAWGIVLELSSFPNTKWQDWLILIDSLVNDDTRWCQKLSGNKCTTTVQIIPIYETSG